MDIEFSFNDWSTNPTLCFRRKTIKDIIEEIKREENLAKPEEAERNGITREMRRDRANRLKRSLAGKQAKFLRTSGDDEARLVNDRSSCEIHTLSTRPSPVPVPPLSTRGLRNGY